MGLIKKWLSVVLTAVVMVVTAIPVNAQEIIIKAQDNNTGADAEDVNVDVAEDTLLDGNLGGEVITDWEYALGSDYTNDGNIVYLYYYKGSATNVRVPSSFTIDGIANPTRYTVIESSSAYNSIFSDVVVSVSFENGVKAGDDINHMFANCDKLKNVNLSGLNTGSSANIQGMFKNCSSLESIDVSSMDVSKVARVENHSRNTFSSELFRGCSSLKSIDLSSWTIDAYGDLDHMFTDCTSLETVKFCNITEPSDEDKGSTGRNTKLQGAFSGCSKLKSITFPNRLNLDNCDDLSYLFYGCTSLESIDMSSWYFSKPDMEDIPGRFYLNVDSMFQNCSSLTTVKMPKIYRAISISHLFSGCSNLVTADLSEMDMSMQIFMGESGYDMAAYAFEGDTKLRTIKSPVNVLLKMALPSAFMGSDGVRYTNYPMNKTESITLTLDGSSTVPLESISFAKQGVDQLTEVTLDMDSVDHMILWVRFAPENATYKDAEFTISDPTVLRIEKIDQTNYTVYPLKAGVATVTATATDGSGVSGSFKVYVTGEVAHVTSVKLDKTEVNIGIGKSITLHATVLPENAFDKRLVWEMGADCEGNISITPSEDTLSCTVTGLRLVEDARLSVSSVDSSDYDICFIRVTKNGDTPQPEPDDKVTGVTLNYTQISMKAGDERTIKAVIHPDNAANKNVSWLYTKPSGDPFSTTRESTVSQDGFIISQTFTVKAFDDLISTKSAVITVTTADGGYTANCLVTVYPADQTITIPDQPDPGYVEPVPPSSAITLVKGQKYDASSLLAAYLCNKKNKLTVSNPKVASVSAKGLITAKGYADTAQILCNGESTGISIRTEVPKAVVKTVIINNLNSTYNAVNNLSGLYSAVPRWETASSKNPIAMIDPYTGLITPIKTGSIKVNAVFDNMGAKGSVKVPFTVKIVVPQLSKTCLVLGKGKSAKVTLKNVASGLNVTWDNNNSYIFTETVSGKNNETLTIQAVDEGCTVVTASVDGMDFDFVVAVTDPKYKEYSVPTAGKTITGYYDWKATAEFIDQVLAYRKANGVSYIEDLKDLGSVTMSRVKEIPFTTSSGYRPDGSSVKSYYTENGGLGFSESTVYKNGKAAFKALVADQNTSNIMLRPDVTKMSAIFFKTKESYSYSVKSGKKVVKKSYNYVSAITFGK